MRFQMNKTKLKELMKIDLLNINPMLTGQIRQKTKPADNKSIYKKIIRQYIMSAVMMIVIYGLMFGLIFDYSKAPKAYDLFVFYLVILGTLQNFISVFNLFYENKDSLKMSYFPISQKEMFISKTFLTMLSSLTVLSPILLLSIKFFIDFKFNIFLAILFGILNFVVLFVFTIILNIVVAELLVRTSALYKFNTQIMVGLNIFIQVVAIVFVIFIQNSKIMKNATGLGPISGILHNPLSAIIFIAALAVVEVILGKAILEFASKNLYEHMSDIQNRKNSVKRTKVDKEPSNIGKEMFKYNKMLLSDATTITSCILFPVMFPIIMTFTNLTNMRSDLGTNISDLQSLAVALSISFMYSVFIGLFPMNLQSIIVSLDGQNHDYLMSLPMNKKTYLNEKVKFSALIMGALSALAILGCSIFFRVKFYFIIVAIVLNLISIFVFCRFKVAGDYKHKYVNWSSISDIMNRQSKFAYVIKMMGLSFLTIAIFSFVMFSIQSAPIKWILLGILIPWALIVIGIELYNQIGFWRKIK